MSAFPVPLLPSLREGELTEVVRALEEDIIFGRLAPGQRLVEDGLMERFGATRHAIRTALGELDRIGIVVRSRHLGAAVRTYTREEVWQIYEVREVLQRQAALMIQLPAPLELRQRLATWNERFAVASVAGDLRAVHEANDTFHLMLFEACGNAYLVGSIRHYMGLSLPMRAKTLADAKAFALSHSQHGVMIGMLAECDTWALSQLCVDHVQPSKWDYLQRVDRPMNRARKRS